MSGFEVFSPPSRHQQMREMADRQGYVTLLLPGRRIKWRVLNPRRGPRRLTLRQRRRNRVARAQIRYALARIEDQARLRDIEDALHQACAAGELREVGPELFAPLPTGEDRRSERVRSRRVRIERLWRDGLSQKEIAARVFLTFGAFNQEIVRMRKAGWNLPHRYPGWTPEALVRHREACRDSWHERHSAPVRRL